MNHAMYILRCQKAAKTPQRYCEGDIFGQKSRNLIHSTIILICTRRQLHNPLHLVIFFVAAQTVSSSVKYSHFASLSCLLHDTHTLLSTWLPGPS